MQVLTSGIEWLNDNQIRNYPLEQDKVAQYRLQGSPTWINLPNSLFLDARFSVDEGTAPIQQVQIQKDVNGLIYIVFSGGLIAEIPDIRVYPLYLDTEDWGSVVLWNFLENLLQQIPLGGVLEFNNCFFDDFCVNIFPARYKGVTSVTFEHVQDKLGTPVITDLPITAYSAVTMTGNLIFYRGYNTDMYQRTNRNEIELIQARQNGYQVSCDMTFQDQSDCSLIISSINNTYPNTQGQITVTQGVGLLAYPGNQEGQGNVINQEGVDVAQHSLFIAFSDFQVENCQPIYNSLL